MFDIIAITISFIGSLLLAFSISKNPGEAYQEIKGKKKYFTIIQAELFRLGVGLIAIGFALQIIGRICRIQ